MLAKNPAGHFFLLLCLVAFSGVANAQIRQPQGNVLQRARSYNRIFREPPQNMAWRRGCCG